MDPFLRIVHETFCSINHLMFSIQQSEPMPNYCTLRGLKIMVQHVEFQRLAKHIYCLLRISKYCLWYIKNHNTEILFVTADLLTNQTFSFISR